MAIYKAEGNPVSSKLVRASYGSVLVTTLFAVPVCPCVQLPHPGGPIWGHARLDIYLLANWVHLFAARRLAWQLAVLSVLNSWPQRSCAQTAAGLSSGLRGDYYKGLNFEHLMRTQRDARLDFDWHEHSPVPGVPATSFTVSWTGWLVPPVTGHYVLHLTGPSCLLLDIMWTAIIPCKSNGY